MNAPIKPINLQLDISELDFAVQRLTAGTMDFPTSQRVSALLAKLQSQANDPAIQGLVAPPPPAAEGKKE